MISKKTAADLPESELLRLAADGFAYMLGQLLDKGIPLKYYLLSGSQQKHLKENRIISGQRGCRKNEGVA